MQEGESQRARGSLVGETYASLHIDLHGFLQGKQDRVTVTITPLCKGPSRSSRPDEDATNVVHVVPNRWHWLEAEEAQGDQGKERVDTQESALGKGLEDDKGEHSVLSVPSHSDTQGTNDEGVQSPTVSFSAQSYVALDTELAYVSSRRRSSQKVESLRHSVLDTSPSAALSPPLQDFSPQAVAAHVFHGLDLGKEMLAGGLAALVGGVESVVQNSASRPGSAMMDNADGAEEGSAMACRVDTEGGGDGVHFVFKSSQMARSKVTDEGVAVIGREQTVRGVEEAPAHVIKGDSEGLGAAESQKGGQEEVGQGMAGTVEKKMMEDAKDKEDVKKMMEDAKDKEDKGPMGWEGASQRAREDSVGEAEGLVGVGGGVATSEGSKKMRGRRRSTNAASPMDANAASAVPGRQVGGIVAGDETQGNKPEVAGDSVMTVKRESRDERVERLQREATEAADALRKALSVSQSASMRASASQAGPRDSAYPQPFLPHSSQGSQQASSSPSAASPSWQQSSLDPHQPYYQPMAQSSTDSPSHPISRPPSEPSIQQTAQLFNQPPSNPYSQTPSQPSLPQYQAPSQASSQSPPQPYYATSSQAPHAPSAALTHSQPSSLHSQAHFNVSPSANSQPIISGAAAVFEAHQGASYGQESLPTVTAASAQQDTPIQQHSGADRGQGLESAHPWSHQHEVQVNVEQNVEQRSESDEQEEQGGGGGDGECGANGRPDGWHPDNPIESVWSSGPRRICRHPQEFPDARLVSPTGDAAQGGDVGVAQEGGSGPMLVTSVSKISIEQGPRALQQDFGLVEAVPGRVPVICICDGHGSVSMLQVDQAKTPRDVRNMVHVGGAQAAEIGARAVIDFVKANAQAFRLNTADAFFHHAFVHAHHSVLEHLRMGSREDDDREAGLQSGMDGSYFKNMDRLIINLNASRQTAVARKVTRGEATFYQRGNGSWVHADFGTTCTACAFLNAPDDERRNRKVVLTAHAGDSDACLLRFTKPKHSGQKSVLLFAQWLTKEHTLHSAEERMRPIRDGKVLADGEGVGSLKNKVRVTVTLPNGEDSGVAYEPTRGLGHCEAQHAGIVPSPTVSCVEVEADDIVIVGTDGLWSALGGRRQAGYEGEPQQEVTGPLLASLRNWALRYRHLDVQQMTAELMGMARARGLVDNVCLAIAKVSERPAGQEASSGVSRRGVEQRTSKPQGRAAQDHKGANGKDETGLRTLGRLFHL